MRTENDRERAASISRRAFVIGAGTAVAASTTGSAASADETTTVEVTAPYHSTVRAVVDAYERDGGGGSAVDVRRANGGPIERVVEGPADVHVSGAPVPRADGAATALEGGVAVHGWATLAAGRSDWYESLRGASLRARMGGDRPVETWSETDWASVTSLEGGSGDEDVDRCAGVTDTDAEDRSVIVRGTRAFQYARGFGGVGFYEVDSADVGAPSASRDRGDDVVPLARLGYVRVDRDAVDRRSVSDFLRFYRRHATDTDGLALHAESGFTPAGRGSTA